MFGTIERTARRMPMQPRMAVPVRGAKQKQLFRIKTIPLAIYRLLSVLIWINIGRNSPPLGIYGHTLSATKGEREREREREEKRECLEGRVGTRKVLT